MKNDIIAALNGVNDSVVNTNKKFGDAILVNISADIEITYSWSATNPDSGVPDPVTFFSATVSGNGTLTPSDSFPAMLLKLAALIKSLTISAASGFLVAPLDFNPAGVFTVVMANETTQDDAMQHFCEQVIASLKSSFPDPAPASGSHADFIGETTGMTIQ